MTEAIRGEGAVLLDETGDRFIPAFIPMPNSRRRWAARDLRSTTGRPFGRARRAAVGDAFPQMFPTVFASCMQAGIDPRARADPGDAGRAMIGGVATDDAAALRSPNSGRVAGRVHRRPRCQPPRQQLAARSAVSRGASPTISLPRPRLATSRHRSRARGDPLVDVDEIERLRVAMYASVGVERTRDGLRSALDLIAELRDRATASATLANLTLVGKLVAESALAREESRGTHFRSDFRATDPSLAHRSYVRIESTRV